MPGVNNAAHCCSSSRITPGVKLHRVTLKEKHYCSYYLR